MQLDTKLEAIAKEFSAVESQVLPILDMSTTWGEESRMQADELRRKWQDTSLEWEATQRDADVLGDELKEDKVSLRVSWMLALRISDCSFTHAVACGLQNSLEPSGRNDVESREDSHPIQQFHRGS